MNKLKGKEWSPSIDQNSDVIVCFNRTYIDIAQVEIIFQQIDVFYRESHNQKQFGPMASESSHHHRDGNHLETNDSWESDASKTNCHCFYDDFFLFHVLQTIFESHNWINKITRRFNSTPYLSGSKSGSSLMLLKTGMHESTCGKSVCIHQFLIMFPLILRFQSSARAKTSRIDAEKSPRYYLSINAPAIFYFSTARLKRSQWQCITRSSFSPSSGRRFLQARVCYHYLGWLPESTNRTALQKQRIHCQSSWSFVTDDKGCGNQDFQDTFIRIWRANRAKLVSVYETNRGDLVFNIHELSVIVLSSAV